MTLAVGSVAFFSGLANSAQTVDFSNISRNGVAVSAPVFAAGGDTVQFDAMLTANGASNPPGTKGLGLCLEYARAALGDPILADILSTDQVASGSPTPLSGCTAGQSASVPGADFMVIDGWAALSGSWPNVAIPLKLYDARFTLQSTPSGFTRIGFGASSVSGTEEFGSNGPLLVCGKPTVSVMRTANGSETGSSAATFSVVLSAAIPPECAVGGFFPVTLNLGGTATPPGSLNADYSISGTNIANGGSLVTTASFPANGAATVLTVIATQVNDGQPEGTETVTLTVAAGSGNYTGIGATASATISDTAQAAPMVVEYRDTADFQASPGGHFFYSSDAAEQNAVDNGAAGQFFRTGRQFAIGGTSPVCRFYGSISPGPNSHFFTVDVNECAALKAAQVTPTPTTVQQWNYERIEYMTTPPNVAGDGTRSCPGNTAPLYRAYNNAFPLAGGKNPWDSNHRFTPVHADIDALVALGWRDEGIAFCTPQ
ncbi:MAG: hypothetical protein ABIS68_02160 [Casimicrobiaceae bacterium]